MKKNHYSITICILVLFTACTSHRLQNFSDNDIPLDQLVNHLPANDSVESTLIFNAILDYGLEGVVHICRQLGFHDDQDLVQAKWALHGLAVYVTGRGREQKRELYISGLIKALDLSLPVNQKVFIINQMQISGGSESVSALGSYIDDPDLYEPAIQALTTIGSKSAGEALLKALPTVNGKQKVAIIQALGMMRYEPAGEEILALLNDSNDIVRKLSGFALSNMGYDPANLPLGSMAEKDHQYVPNYLRFAERLGEKGDVESCRAICDEILNNENDYYSDNMRINALSILVKYNPDGARDRLFKMMSGHNKKMRMAALNLVDNYNISEVRMTALKALSEIQDVKSLPDMIFVMQDSLNELVLFLLQSENEKEQAAAIRAIASITNRSTSKKKQIVLIKDYYDKATLDEKMLLFNIFKAVGGDALMKITVQEMQSTDEQIREAAIRTLTEWPDTGALGILIDIGSNDQEERFRILALRGALRILRENPMGEQRALLYYKEIMNASVRPEEKRQVLAGLAEIRTVSSLRLITSVLDDSNVNHEAFFAALAVSSQAEEQNEHLSRDEIVIALVESQSDEELREKIKTYAQNEITKPRTPEGFRSLFNGMNLDGWKGLVENPVKRAQMSEEELSLAQIEADKIMREHWQVIDGILYFDGKGSHLCTVDDYTDFELLVDWKIEKEGDSGIYLRGSPQVQIWDPAQWPEGSGGLYNNQIHPNKPLQKVDNPVGEWNTFRIIMRGDRVTVYLNDILVFDNVVMENYWERYKSIYPSGQIELQSHNTPLYFRNIFIRELEPKKPLFDGYLFNGKDLSGWQVIGNSLDSWQVKDSILYTEGKGGGWLSSTEEYADFKLELEFRIPEGGNSGVFLRAPHQGDPAYTGMEVQILDDYAEEYSELKAWQYTGSLYGLQAPSQRVSKKAGEWQKIEILCDGPEVKVSLNGTPVIEANLIEFMHKEDDHPGIKRRKGYIGLQNHSTKIEYRNIYLMELRR